MVMLHYRGSWTQTLRSPTEIWWKKKNYTIIRKQNHPRATTRINLSSKDPHRIIRDAERDLSDYCAALPGGEEADDCWRAYRFLDEELKSAEQQCELDSRQCTILDKLEDTVREMVFSGEGSEGLAVALATLSRIRDKAKANNNNTSSSSSINATATYNKGDDPNNSEKQLSPFLQWRRELSNLFQQIDSNHDGKIDVEQLSQALKMLGEELDDEELRAALVAVDSHGWVDETDFITIAEAEKERSHDPFVEMWRHKKHVHHDKEGGGD